MLSRGPPVGSDYRTAVGKRRQCQSFWRMQIVTAIAAAVESLRAGLPFAPPCRMTPITRRSHGEFQLNRAINARNSRTAKRQAATVNFAAHRPQHRAYQATDAMRCARQVLFARQLRTSRGGLFLPARRPRLRPATASALPTPASAGPRAATRFF